MSPLRVIESRALAAAPPRDALAALAPRDRVHVIAEIKRASPSRGALATIADPAARAREYAAGGASAISVLTEGPPVRRLRSPTSARSATPSTFRCCGRTFVGNEYQVLEARAYGADLVLLIVAALDEPTITRLHAFVRELGMTPLVEAHSADELALASDLDARLVGVNARDLTTFELDRDLFGRLADDLPAGRDPRRGVRGEDARGRRALPRCGRRRGARRRGARDRRRSRRRRPIIPGGVTWDSETNAGRSSASTGAGTCRSRSSRRSTS